jgi:outer membrane lipoprotein-sorting protein
MHRCHAPHRPRRPGVLGVLGVFFVVSMLFSHAVLAAEESAAEGVEGAVSAASDGADGLDEVVACVRANEPRESVVQEAEITTLDSTGADRTIAAKVYWKRDKKRLSRVYVSVEEPANLRGSAFLMIERADRPDDMWLYLPEIRKVRRISSRTISGSLFGTDFSYEDIKNLRPEFSKDDGRRLPDAEIDGRGMYVVEVEPDASTGSSYSRIVSYVDREYCVPLKMEFYAESDLRKVMTINPEKLTREANIWVPRDIVLRDLDNETESRFVVSEVEIDASIPDRRFTQSQLERGR